MQVVVDGLMTRYSRQGEGRRALLLHGWGDSLATWSHLVPVLSKQYEVIALDLPGFGETSQPDTAWGLQEYSDFVAKFLDKIQAKNLYACIGHSNGGAIAIKAVAHNYISPERLVLLASAGIRQKSSAGKQLIKIMTKTGKLVTLVLPESVSGRLQEKLYQRIGSDYLIAGHMKSTFKRIVAEDVQADAKLITVPTLLMYGEADKATPVLYGELFHNAISGSTLEVIAGAGHFVHRDRSANTASTIQEFLS